MNAPIDGFDILLRHTFFQSRYRIAVSYNSTSCPPHQLCRKTGVVIVMMGQQQIFNI
jgi:hypothetical protein